MSSRRASRRVRVSAPVHGIRQSKVVKVRQEKVYRTQAITLENKRALERQEALTAGLDAESLRILAEMRGEGSSQANDGAPQHMAVDEEHTGNESDWVPVPDEHDDDTAFIHALRDIEGSRWKSRWYKDARTWRQRVQNLDENWRPLIPDLVDAYIAWRYGQSGSSGGDEPVRGLYDFDINVFDIYSLASTATVSRDADTKSAAVALVASGYLGITPFSPSLAVSIKTLELLRSIRLFKASFSVEAFGKLLCHYYMIPYRRHLRTALASTFEVYLTIQRAVKKRILGALGRDGPNWRVLNACPACGYELEGEPPLRWSRMLCIDGNNSLKWLAQIGGRARGDTRVFQDSDYYLSEDFVNGYADEVKTNRPLPSDDAPMGEEESGGAGEEGEGDPTDGASSDATVTPCTRNWKAAASEDKKRMWGIFEETGIFASACRHGFIAWLADMVRSGELAKYPLAIVSKIMEVLGDQILLGYDIGCTFEGTICRSSLGSEWQRRRSRCCVNAFHGYTHNYACQTQNHPNVVDGMGLEDLETLERIFSGSNALAPITRYASAYRRRVFIDEYFQQWDDEKYAALSTMIYQNYVQAIEIIKTESVALVDAMRSLGITRPDLESWYEDERRYFQTLGEESPWDVHAVAYVESLQELRRVRGLLDNASNRFLSTAPSNYQFLQPSSTPVDYYTETSRTRKLETERRYLSEKYEALLRDVVAMEVRLDIANRWQPGDPEYVAASQYLATRKYHIALNNLQRLVIQRLFELHKLNLSQTAYRIRTHVAKSLQARCQAIRNAVQVYNTAATALDPPRPTLDWSKVSHYSFLDEFNLLHDTNNDVREKPWARPAIRETMKQARRIDRAREELIRCNVEARRLRTSIHDEDSLFTTTLAKLRDEKSPLFEAVNVFCQRRRNVNALHIARLQQLERLEDFSGDLSLGRRKGSLAATATSSDSTASAQPSSGSPAVARNELDDEDILEEDEDDIEGDIGGLVEYLSNLSVLSSS
ncbi:hypothetical protein B0H21DRAFT_842744 [Amylocystis lapponica]|nr:hypothetical protein B0H21DRAFT_842744 [Amylocystis lapponica]